MKRLLPIIVFAALHVALVPTRGALGKETIRVVHGDGGTSEEVEVWTLERGSEALYLRASDVARIFRATQFWNPSNRKVVLGIEDTRFTLSVDTRVVVIDGEPVMLRTPVRYEAGFVMVPLEFVLEVASGHTASTFEWDASSRTLRVRRVGYTVEGITFATTAGRSVATITLTEPLVHHVDSTTSGVVRLKIYGGRIDANKFDVREAHGLFNGVRAEQTDRDAFVYFDVKRFASRVLVEREESPPLIRVVLEQGELPEIPEPEFAGRRSIESIDLSRTERRHIEIQTVVLDPGHGGKDNGKIGRSGLMEKDANLRIAKAARDLLERELGVEVVLTREEDQLLSLTRRAEVANQAGGDLFISIHCNSWFSRDTGGFEAYFLSPARTEWDRAVALAENAADEGGGAAAEAASDIDFILWDMVQNEYINESSYFAELIQKEMNDRLEIRNRGVKQANFTVLQGASMPAVLIETAFLSNPTEERLLSNQAFHVKVAEGIVEAVRKFRERYH